MKINFDWQNFLSKQDKVNDSNNMERFSNTRTNVREKSSVYRTTILDISDKITDNFNYGEQGLEATKYGTGVDCESQIAVRRNFMTIMSNSMSVKDFQKMKEEGYHPSSMEPEEVVTILDKIKTALAQAGTKIKGYNDNLSVDTITAVTGNSGYAENIAKELSYADTPVTEENLKEIDKVIDQALTTTEPGEGKIAYLVSQKMEPTLANLYKADHSSVNVNKNAKMTGYASNGYSKQGLDISQVRKTFVSEEEYKQIEQQIKDRIEKDGLILDEKSLECGKWLLERGLPVTGENIELLQGIKDIKFPLDIKQVMKQAAIAIGEGKSPFDVNLNKKDEGIYKEAGKIYERYQKITFQAVDYAVNNHLKCNLKNLETYQPPMETGDPQIQARKALEEVRLKMTVEANVKLLQSGYSIETAPMEELIQKLEQANKEWNESLFGTENTQAKAQLFKETTDCLKEMPGLPIAVLGKISFIKEASVTDVMKEGHLLQQKYEQAKDSYEPLLTAPRADLGDSIQKAFRNADHILEDMELERSEDNQRAIRIMGYSQITITPENLDKVKKADKKVRNIITNMKPALTMKMIKDGKNPLNMSMDEINDYICKNENNFLADTEKYSEFLYKLEKKNSITEEEREAFIGIYRLFRQIEKSDGAVIGSLLAQDANIDFSNLLSAVRTKKAGHTDIKVDDTVGTLSKVNRKGKSISEQIEKGFEKIQKDLWKADKNPDEMILQMKEISKDEGLQKQLLESQKQELRDWVSTYEKEVDYLNQYHQPITLDALQSAFVLNQKRGFSFKKAIEKEKEVSLDSDSSLEESILKEAEKFLSKMDEKEEVKNSYEKIISHTKEVLEQTTEQRSLGYIDLKEIQSVYKQISLASNMAKEENYEIPVQFGEEITSINLKIVHSTENKGEVKITMDTEKFGKVEARFTVTPDGLEGSVLTDYMDGKELLEKGAARLEKALNKALEEKKTEMKGLFFGVNEKLNINALDKGERENSADVSLLYKVAKEFISYLKDVS